MGIKGTIEMQQRGQFDRKMCTVAIYDRQREDDIDKETLTDPLTAYFLFISAQSSLFRSELMLKCIQKLLRSKHGVKYYSQGGHQ